MPLAVSCPECRYQFRVPDHVEGQRGKCPKCKATFLAVREAPPSDAAPATPAVSVAFPANGPPPAAVDTSSMKARTLTIPKPRLLEKLNPAPAAVEIVDDAPPTSAAAPPPPPPATAPPRGAPPKAAHAKTLADAPSLAIQLETAAPRASDAGAGGVYAHRRAKKSKLPLIIGIAALLLLVLAAIGGGIGWSIYSKRPLVADRTKSNDAADAANSSSANGTGERDDFAQPGHDRSPAPFMGDLENWEELRAAIVTIDVLDAGGTRSGTGWLLEGGLVATDFQTLHEADAAIVTLADGRRFEAAGVLQRPRVSLALLQLVAAPDEMPALALAAEPPPVEAGLFIGDALSATPARVVRRVDVSALPAAMRPRLPELMRDNDEIQLIEHDGRTSTTPQGLTYETPGGAPLLDKDGRVVGVNLALGGDSRKGYAVGVELVQRLVAASAEEEFRPLLTGDIATVDPLEPLPENPFDEPADNPLDTPPATDDPFAPALEKFGALQAALAEKSWRPENAGDYLGFAEFAHSATELTAMIDKLEPAEQETRRATIVAAIEQLADAAWPTADQQAAVNKLTAADLPSGDSPGVFAYGRCILRPEDFGDKTVDGLPLFAFELPGTESLVLLPIGENGADIATGSEWLILGTKDLTQSVRISTPTAPDAPRDAAIIRAKYMLGKPGP